MLVFKQKRMEKEKKKKKMVAGSPSWSESAI